jgi:hypothetical protein
VNHTYYCKHAHLLTWLKSLFLINCVMKQFWLMKPHSHQIILTWAYIFTTNQRHKLIHGIKIWWHYRVTKYHSPSIQHSNSSHEHKMSSNEHKMNCYTAVVRHIASR